MFSGLKLFQRMQEIRKKRTGYVYEELCMWHNPTVKERAKWLEPSEFWEHVDTKRLINYCKYN